MEPRISLITLGVRDLERMRRFYQDGLGWSMSSASTPEVAFFHTTGAVLALWVRDLLAADANIQDPGSGDGFAGIALAHNVPSKEQVDEVLATAERAGATILKRGQDAVWGGYTGYFADPEGYPWEVAWNPFFPFNADGSVRLPD